MLPISYARHQFPLVLIQHVTWLYIRFWTARPASVAILAIFGLAWFTFAEKFGWAEIATLATLTITLFIRRRAPGHPGYPR